MKEKVAQEKEKNQQQEKIAKELADKKKLAKKDESGLMVYIEKEGKGRKPKRGETITVHYTGYLTNGKKFDSSVDRGTPFTFKVGVGQVIAGWDKGLLQMKEGEKAILYIPYYMAYGDRAVGNVIPPKSDLIFEVELLKIGQ
jgi:peptidylprolyl isomerase